MSALEKIAFFQNRRDEVPNQLLARELSSAQDHAGIQEIAGNLWNKNQNIRSDCLKVLRDRNNRMVWGGMIALATIGGKRSPFPALTSDYEQNPELAEWSGPF